MKNVWFLFGLLAFLCFYLAHAINLNCNAFYSCRFELFLVNILGLIFALIGLVSLKESDEK